jgi:hypothetical protein
MDVEVKAFCDSIPSGRCKGCPYADVVRAQGNFVFLGCRHKPYKGKWVAEIKECPKKGDAEQYGLMNGYCILGIKVLER